MQQKIGWNQFLRGRISKHWIEAHNEYILQCSSNISHSSSNISTRLILSLWNFSLSCWKNRNPFKFGSTPAERLNFRSKTVDEKIQQLYHNKKAIPSLSHSIVNRLSLQDLLQQSVNYKENWTDMFTAITLPKSKKKKRKRRRQPNTSTNPSVPLQPSSNSPSTHPPVNSPPQPIYYPIFRNANRNYIEAMQRFQAWISP